MVHPLPQQLNGWLGKEGFPLGHVQVIHKDDVLLTRWGAENTLQYGMWQLCTMCSISCAAIRATWDCQELAQLAKDSTGIADLQTGMPQPYNLSTMQPSQQGILMPALRRLSILESMKSWVWLAPVLALKVINTGDTSVGMPPISNWVTFSVLPATNAVVLTPASGYHDDHFQNCQPKHKC